MAVGDEGDENDWRQAQTFFNLSKEVDLLRRRVSALNDTSIKTERSEKGLETLSGRQDLVKITSANTADSDESIDHSQRRPLIKRKTDYPQYHLRGEVIVKRGLARDRRSEYEHIVPKDDFERVVSSLMGVASIGSEFTAEMVQVNLNIPAYRTYIVLSLLRKLGILELPKRGTYSLADRNRPASSLESLWETVCTSLGQETRQEQENGN